LNDEGALSAIFGSDVKDAPITDLGEKTAALVRLAGLVATESSFPSYQWVVGQALAAGATEDEIVEVLVALAPIVGLARVHAAVPELSLALGYGAGT
jgi:alkylhydroperoxidase/carboxymuconolactone decarboxylase family protein YurZ